LIRETAARRNNIRLRIKVFGTVQGVGFRYFTQRLASDLGLEGFVKNMPDGTVQVEVEGDQDSIESFIKRLYEGPAASRVSKIDTEDLPSGGDYGGFEIRL